MLLQTPQVNVTDFKNLCINSFKIYFKVSILLLFAKSGKGTFLYVTGNVTGCN